RHIGIYAYRAGFIKQYINMSPSGIEQVESLEQLRVLWHGEKIHVEEAKKPPPTGIDTPEDLKRLLQTINKD
ncbi:MAG: 3-deoxy-manno-octulosonate cytidylyltransferase, partial [Paraglaciecola sp.]